MNTGPIALIHGVVLPTSGIENDRASVIVLTDRGVGYEVIGNNVIPTSDVPTDVHVLHAIGEGVEVMYGFSSREELACARELMNVQGVGAALAARTVHLCGVQRLLQWISEGNATDIQKAVKGLGGKRSLEIVEKLKETAVRYRERAGWARAASPNAAMSERIRRVVEAAVALGIRADVDRIATLVENQPPETPVGYLTRLYCDQQGAQTT